MVVVRANSKSLWTAPSHVLDRLQGTGFENLAKILEPFEYMTTLTTTLVKFYDYKSKCFVLNDLNFFLGLEDILKVIGLPIDGRPVTGLDGRDISFVEEYLKGKKHELNIVGGGITLGSLRNAYANSDGMGDDSDEYVRAYVLYLIGCAITPKAKPVVPGHFLPFLKDVGSIKDYAWGAAMLSYMHNDLRHAIVSGFVQSLLLTIFILEHVTRVRTIFHVDGELPNTFPLALGWIEQLRDRAMNHNSTPTISSLHDLFTQLQHEEITWFPYDRLSEVFLPDPYNQQVYMGYSLTSIFCMEKRILHDPTRRTGVGHVSKEIISHRKKLLDLYEDANDLSRKGYVKKDWTFVHAEFLEHWDQRKDYLVNQIDGGVGADSASSYILEDDLADNQGFCFLDDPTSSSTFEDDLPVKQSFYFLGEELQNEHAQSYASMAFDLLMLMLHIVEDKESKIQHLLQRANILEEDVKGKEKELEELKALQEAESQKNELFEDFQKRLGHAIGKLQQVQKILKNPEEEKGPVT